MKHFSDLQRRQIAQALLAHKYEAMPGGQILLPDHKLALGGVFTSDVNGGDRSIDPNRVVTEGLVNLLVTFFQRGAQAAGFYLAPFSGNVAPAATLNAANFATTQTEFTAYSEAARVVWTPPVANVTTPTIDNSASVATFTVNADAQTVWGFGLLTASAKSATTGVLVAASQFSQAKAVNTGDKLNTTYSFTASDAG